MPLVAAGIAAGVSLVGGALNKSEQKNRAKNENALATDTGNRTEATVRNRDSQYQDLLNQIYKQTGFTPPPAATSPYANTYSSLPGELNPTDAYNQGYQIGSQGPQLPNQPVGAGTPMVNKPLEMSGTDAADAAKAIAGQGTATVPIQRGIYNIANPNVIANAASTAPFSTNEGLAPSLAASLQSPADRAKQAQQIQTLGQPNQ